MNARFVYAGETKHAGYVMAAVTVPDPDAARRVVRGLVLPGQRRLHMHSEQARRRRAIVSALTTLQITITIYDAARRYHTDRGEARAACLSALVEDLATTRSEIHLVIEQDDSLVSYDNQRLIEAIRTTGQRNTLHYEHAR